MATNKTLVANTNYWSNSDLQALIYSYNSVVKEPDTTTIQQSLMVQIFKQLDVDISYTDYSVYYIDLDLNLQFENLRTFELVLDNIITTRLFDEL